jgi:hypothetical protein
VAGKVECKERHQEAAHGNLRNGVAYDALYAGSQLRRNVGGGTRSVAAAANAFGIASL